MLISLTMRVFKLSVDTHTRMIYCSNTQSTETVSVGVKFNIFCQDTGDLQDYIASQPRSSKLTNMYSLPFIFNNRS
jgi:hypothetical protein